MDRIRHLVKVIMLAVVLVIFGTLGYMFIEGWNALDSLYMTVITLATVGYTEVHPISRIGQIYTIFLIIVGVATFFYVGGAVIQFMVEGRMRILLGRRRLDRKIARLKNHYILCGYGRIGKVICQRLLRESIDLLVIDKDPVLLDAFEAMGVTYISGDAGDEAVLVKGGIERARGLVAALATDTDNVFLVLTARQIAPKLKIIARAGSEGAKSKLRAAGADVVEAPYETGAATMAQRILRPTVTNFLDLAFGGGQQTEIHMEEIPVVESSALNGVMLKDSGIRQKYNLIIVAIKKRDDKMLFNPSHEAILNPGDTVIAVGEPANLKKLEGELNPGRSHTAG